ncbi:MAG: 4Fe-4S ferredoxin [Rhodospirillaceae bacterium]|nr:4Fe-4S ferredoxin [Rhodospirillaceae bacterium]
MVFGPGATSFASRGRPNTGAKHQFAYVININNCIGCGNCVRACKRENSVPTAQFRTWVERYVTTDKGVYVESPGGALKGFEAVNAGIRAAAKRSFTVPKMCNHCEDPPCVQVCPVGATFKTEEGFVLVDHGHCLGCAYCVQACPYGARFINKDIHKSDKCSWCYHRVKKGKLPACVTVCPNKARLFGDLKDPESEVTQIFNEDTWMVLKPEMHTDPTCFYIGLPREVV